MATTKLEQFEEMIRNAVLDETFREKLIDSPQEAAETFGMQLNDAELEKLQSITPHLLRFGEKQGLHPDDVNCWSRGVIHIYSFTTLK